MNGSGDITGRRVFWSVALIGATVLAVSRFILTYRSDSPLGIAAGIATFTFILLALIAGLLRSGTSWLARFARDIHCPLGALAVAAALAHWHVRWRDSMGLATAVLLLIVALSLSLERLRRVKPLKLVHKYGGYALVLLALTHGVRALFFAGN